MRDLLVVCRQCMLKCALVRIVALHSNASLVMVEDWWGRLPAMAVSSLLVSL